MFFKVKKVYTNSVSCGYSIDIYLVIFYISSHKGFARRRWEILWKRSKNAKEERKNATDLKQIIAKNSQTEKKVDNMKTSDKIVEVDGRRRISKQSLINVSVAKANLRKKVFAYAAFATVKQRRSDEGEFALVNRNLLFKLEKDISELPNTADISFHIQNRTVRFDSAAYSKLFHISNRSHVKTYRVWLQLSTFFEAFPGYCRIPPGCSVPVKIKFIPPLRTHKSCKIEEFLRIRSFEGFPMERLSLIAFNGPRLKLYDSELTFGFCGVGLHKDMVKNNFFIYRLNYVRFLILKSLYISYFAINLILFIPYSLFKLIMDLKFRVDVLFKLILARIRNFSLLILFIVQSLPMDPK